QTLKGLAKIAQSSGDLPQAAALFQQALAIVRDLDSKGAPDWEDSTAFALINLANVTIAQGDQKRARALLDEAWVVSRTMGDRMRRSSSSIDQGHALLSLGDYAAARSCFEEGLALRRAEKAIGYIAWALLEAGHAAWLQ